MRKLSSTVSAVLAAGIYSVLSATGAWTTFTYAPDLGAFHISTAAGMGTCGIALVAGAAAALSSRGSAAIVSKRTAVAVFLANGIPVIGYGVVASALPRSWPHWWSLANSLLIPPLCALVGARLASRDWRRRPGLMRGATAAVGVIVIAVVAGYLARDRVSFSTREDPWAAARVREFLRDAGIDLQDVRKRYPLGGFIFLSESGGGLTLQQSILPDSPIRARNARLLGMTIGSVGVRTPRIDVGAITLESTTRTVDRITGGPAALWYLEGEGYAVEICIEILEDRAPQLAWIVGFRGTGSNLGQLPPPDRRLKGRLGSRFCRVSGGVFVEPFTSTVWDNPGAY